jgi:hypothetical protein
MTYPRLRLAIEHNHKEFVGHIYRLIWMRVIIYRLSINSFIICMLRGLYARHYNPRLVYVLSHFWRPFHCFQGVFFRKFCPYVWLVFKSGF